MPGAVRRGRGRARRNGKGRKERRSSNGGKSAGIRGGGCWNAGDSFASVDLLFKEVETSEYIHPSGGSNFPKRDQYLVPGRGALLPGEYVSLGVAPAKVVSAIQRPWPGGCETPWLTNVFHECVTQPIEGSISADKIREKLRPSSAKRGYYKRLASRLGVFRNQNVNSVHFCLQGLLFNPLPGLL